MIFSLRKITPNIHATIGDKYPLIEVNTIPALLTKINLNKLPAKNGGIFHCFTGTLDQANKIISMGMKIGIGGVVTFKNGNIDKFLKNIDIKNIVLETDSPYLSPKPFRGKRNESSNITLIADKLCDIYGLSINEIADITTKNSKDVFGV